MSNARQISRLSFRYIIPGLVATLVLTISGFCVSGDENSVRTLGANQIYKSPDALWLTVDLDAIVKRGAYSEPPSIEQNIGVHVFRVDLNGAIMHWQLPRKPGRSASQNFSFLVSVRSDVFLVFDADSSAYRLTSNGKRLPEATPISLEKLVGSKSADVVDKPVREELAKASKEDQFFRTQFDIYGMGKKESNLPEELAKIEVRFSAHPSGWGAERISVKSDDPEMQWTKTLIDSNPE